MDNKVKTVCMILRTHTFIQPIGEIYTLDRNQNGKQSTDASSTISLRRSLWSFTVEAIIEYCRISFDLFSISKPISLISVDSEEKILSLWYDADQSLEAVWKAFSTEASCSKFLNLDSNVLPGLFSCKNVLQLPTPTPTVRNIGRVIIIGSKIREKINDWLPGLMGQLRQPPKEAGYLPIDSSEWFFLDLDPDLTATSTIMETVLVPSGPHRMFYQQVPLNNSRAVFRAVMRLAERNLNLASTLVQDIPMKEEANVSSSSTMYGVELLHEAKAHDFLARLGLSNQLYVHQQTQKTELQEPPSGLSKTLGIKWVTPRATDSLLIRYSIAAFRVTMAAVGNRASVCLSQFVLGGRCVVLAHKLPPPGPSALPDSLQSPSDAFLLMCHGSVMYLHVLATAANLAHPLLVPTIASRSSSSSMGEQWRVDAFVKNFLHPARLAPASANSVYAIAPKFRALQHVERCTRYWPLKNDDTILGGNPLAAPLFEHLPKDFLEPTEYKACEAAVGSIIGLIQSHPVLKENPSNLVDSQPIAMAVELYVLTQCYADLSEEHNLLSNDLQVKMNTINLANKSLASLVHKAVEILRRGKASPECGLSQLTEVARKLAVTGVDVASSLAGSSSENEYVRSSLGPFFKSRNTASL